MQNKKTKARQALATASALRTAAADADLAAAEAADEAQLARWLAGRA